MPTSGRVSLRPSYNDYIESQDRVGLVVHEFSRQDGDSGVTLEQLNRTYSHSFLS